MSTERVKLAPFQKEGVLAIEACGGRTLLGDEMRLGKTIQALYYARRNQPWPMVVVCPGVAKYQWERQAAVQIGVRAVVCETRKPWPRGMVRPADIIIINYEIAPQWVEYLKALNPQCIILDEGHRLANPNNKTSQAILELCRGVDKVLVLTGTALVNRPIELFTTTNLLWPDEFPSRVDYGFRYCRPRMNRGKMEFTGASHLDELHGKLKKCGMIRRLFSEVVTDMPAPTPEVVLLPLHDPKGEYKHADIDFLGWLRSKSPGRAWRASFNESFARVGYLKRLAARLKLKYAVEWVDRFLEETDEKIVLFGTSTPLIRAVQRRYGNACVTVDGNVTGRKRDAAIHEFQTQRKTRVLMGNIIAAGEAITLSAASNIGFMEFDWRPGKNKQARARCTFIGQTKPTFVYYFVAAGTMEVRLCEVLQKKEETITQVLDGDEAAIDFNILDMLLEKMAEDANARIPTISHR